MRQTIPFSPDFVAQILFVRQSLSFSHDFDAQIPFVRQSLFFSHDFVAQTHYKPKKHPLIVDDSNF